MRSSIRSGLFLTFATIGLALSLPGSAKADNQPRRDMVKEKAIWDQLHSIAPSAVESFKTATIDLDKDDYAAAATMFKKVLDRAPGFEAAQRRLGISLVLAGKPEEGKPMLEALVSKHRSPENLGSLADVLGQSYN
ncbi:MAG: tetratricopeptide repeat protein, partial [Blastocatellia bacterium]